jgi:hypothetical protein
MVNVWRVIMPLYTPSNSLEHSNRIAYVHVDRKTYQDSAEAIDSIIAPHIPALREISDARDFLKHVAPRIGKGSTNFNFNLALTYLRVGNVDQATSLLKKLPDEIDQFYQAYQSLMPELKMKATPYDNFLKQTARRIVSDPAGSAALLDEWVEQNVQALGLQATRTQSARTPNEPPFLSGVRRQ